MCDVFSFQLWYLAEVSDLCQSSSDSWLCGLVLSRLSLPDLTDILQGPEFPKVPAKLPFQIRALFLSAEAAGGVHGSWAGAVSVSCHGNHRYLCPPSAPGLSLFSRLPQPSQCPHRSPLPVSCSIFCSNQQTQLYCLPCPGSCWLNTCFLYLCLTGQ